MAPTASVSPDDEVVVHAGTREHAARRGAVLAGVVVRVLAQVLDQRVDVGVVEHDHRRLAAQLEVHPLERVGRGPGDHLAGGDVAGERHHGDARVRDQRRAGGLALAGDDVEHAGRQDVGGDLGEPQRGERGELGRLEHHGVAGRERGARPSTWPC